MALMMSRKKSGSGNTGIMVAFNHVAGSDRSGCQIADFSLGEFLTAGPTLNAVTTLQSTNVTMRCMVGSVSGSTNSLICAKDCEVYSQNGTLLGTFNANTEIIGSAVAPASTGLSLYYLVLV